MLTSLGAVVGPVEQNSYEALLPGCLSFRWTYLCLGAAGFLIAHQKWIFGNSFFFSWLHRLLTSWWPSTRVNTDPNPLHTLAPGGAEINKTPNKPVSGVRAKHLPAAFNSPADSSLAWGLFQKAALASVLPWYKGNLGFSVATNLPAWRCACSLSLQTVRRGLLDPDCTFYQAPMRTFECYRFICTLDYLFTSIPSSHISRRSDHRKALGSALTPCIALFKFFFFLPAGFLYKKNQWHRSCVQGKRQVVKNVPFALESFWNVLVVFNNAKQPGHVTDMRAGSSLNAGFISESNNSRSHGTSATRKTSGSGCVCDE